jgi:hypothetical protein
MEVAIRQTPKGHRLDITQLYAYKAKGQVRYWGLDNTTLTSVDEVLEALRPVVEDLRLAAENDERPEPVWGGESRRV